ncbi:MAG: thermonuclease family protein [Candidatus Binatia bacterium]|nr:thermonuclease family protein [Candidatus Binatia bacterium]
MRPYVLHKRAIILWVLLLSLSADVPLFAAPLVHSGTVIGITDGDTIQLLEQEKTSTIRLAEIDAPERGQAFATQSKKALANLVFGKEVIVVEQGRDRYGRIVGTVYVGTVNVNAEMVRQGMAWVSLRYAKDPGLLRLEGQTRAEKRGLWVDPHAIAPWEYRHGKNGASHLARVTAEDTQAGTITDNAEPPTAQGREDQDAPASGAIIGNRNSKIYHWPGCPNYRAIAPQNRIFFTSRAEAEAAGFRAARNCR